jgi:hypothetical protein
LRQLTQRTKEFSSRCSLMVRGSFLLASATRELAAKEEKGLECTETTKQEMHSAHRCRFPEPQALTRSATSKQTGSWSPPSLMGSESNKWSQFEDGFSKAPHAAARTPYSVVWPYRPYTWAAERPSFTSPVSCDCRLTLAGSGSSPGRTRTRGSWQSGSGHRVLAAEHVHSAPPLRPAREGQISGFPTVSTPVDKQQSQLEISQIMSGSALAL